MSAPRVDIRLGQGGASQFLPGLTPTEVLGRLEDLSRSHRSGLSISVRPSSPTGAQLVGWTDAAALARASARGYEPAAVVETQGRLAVWLRASQTPDAIRPYVDRATRIAFDLKPVSPVRGAFGPLAGFNANLVASTGAVFSASPQLVGTLTAAVAEHQSQLRARLASSGVPGLGGFRAAADAEQSKGAVEVAWARLALSRGVAQGDVVSVLVTQGIASRSATPQHRLAQAMKTLAKALGHSPSSGVAPALWKAVASVAGLSVKILAGAVKLVRLGSRLSR